MKSLPLRLMEMHRHLGHEREKMTVLYGEGTLIEVSLLLAEAAQEIRRLQKNPPIRKLQAHFKPFKRKS